MDNVGSAAWTWVLKGDPVPWLLEERNPCVRYRTLTELLERPADDPEVRTTAAASWAWPPAAGVLAALREATPLPESAVWSMALFKRNLGDLDTLHRFGVPGGHPVIDHACDRWLDVALVPHAECYPMQMIAGLTRYADPADPRLCEKVRYVLANEPFTDGNRPGALRYGTGRAGCEGSHSCHMAVAKALWAVIGLPTDRRSPEVKRFMQRGARYLATHRLYQASHQKDKVISKQFVDLHLPFAAGCDTDVLDLLDIATQVGLDRDESIADALDLLLSKQTEQGRWRVEARGRWTPDRRRLAGQVATVEKVGDESKWITLGAVLVLKRCAGFLAGEPRSDVGREADPDDGTVLARYPFGPDAADERRVRAEWTALGMEAVLEQMLTVARKRQWRMGWHWGFAMGPEPCPEWCAATVRWIPRRGMAKSWPVCRVYFLCRAGRFTEEGLSRSLKIPVADEEEKGRLKEAFWPHLWRIRVGRWRPGYDEVGVTLRHASESKRLLPLMECALDGMPAGRRWPVRLGAQAQ